MIRKETIAKDPQPGDTEMNVLARNAANKKRRGGCVTLTYEEPPSITRIQNQSEEKGYLRAMTTVLIFLNHELERGFLPSEALIAVGQHIQQKTDDFRKELK